MVHKERRHTNGTTTVAIDILVRDRLNVYKEKQKCPDQKTAFKAVHEIAENFCSEQPLIEMRDNSTPNFIGTRSSIVELIEGTPCRICCAPVVVQQLLNFGTSINIVYICKKHPREGILFTRTKSRKNSRGS